jgi:hypothetical protein
LQNEGYDAKAYLVETHMRFAKAVVPVLGTDRNTSLSLANISTPALSRPFPPENVTLC